MKNDFDQASHNRLEEALLFYQTLKNGIATDSLTTLDILADTIRLAMDTPEGAQAFETVTGTDKALFEKQISNTYLQFAQLKFDDLTERNGSMSKPQTIHEIETIREAMAKSNKDLSALLSPREATAQDVENIFTRILRKSGGPRFIPVQ